MVTSVPWDIISPVSMVSHPFAGPQGGRCMYLMPLHVWYKKKTFESYTLWVNFQVFLSELQFSLEEASTIWNEVAQIRISVELDSEYYTYFFHTSGAPRLNIQQPAWNRFMQVVQKYFCFVSLCWHIYTRMIPMNCSCFNGFLFWFFIPFPCFRECLILAQSSMIIFDQTDMAFLFASSMCFVTVSATWICGGAFAMKTLKHTCQ